MAKNLGKLHKKTITDKNGKRTTVWVADGKVGVHEVMKHPDFQKQLGAHEKKVMGGEKVNVYKHEEGYSVESEHGSFAFKHDGKAAKVMTKKPVAKKPEPKETKTKVSKQPEAESKLTFEEEAKKYKSADEFLAAQTMVYHGSANKIKGFNNKTGVFFTDDQMNADGYAGGENVYEGYLVLKNPLIIDAKGRKWDDLKTEYGKSTQEVVGKVDAEKHDGVVFKNIKDSWIDDADYQDPSTIYYSFKPKDAFKNEDQLREMWEKANKPSVEKKKAYGGELPPELKKKIERREKGKGEEIKLTKEEVFDILQKGEVGFVSAGVNPADEADKKLTPEQVKERDKKLRADLVQDGFTFMPVTGKYGELEESYMVMVNEISEPELEKLGVKYNQSVIYSAKGKNNMIFTTGANKGKKHVGNGFQDMKGADDFYTEITTPKEKLKIQLSFDFDKLVEKALKNLMRLWE